MKEVGTGQKNSVSALSMARCHCSCDCVWTAQCSQADGAVPNTSLDHLFERETSDIKLDVNAMQFHSFFF